MRQLIAAIALLATALSLWPQTIIVTKKKGGGSSPTAEFVDSAVGFNAAAGGTLVTGTQINVSTGNIIVAFAGGANGITTTGVSCGSNTLTAGITQTSDNYPRQIWYHLSATNAGSTTCTATYDDLVATYRTLIVVNYTKTGTATLEGASCNDAACAALASSSTNRTAQNVTVAATTSLNVAIGVDWDNDRAHTEANGFTKRVDTADLQWAYDKLISGAGSYPGGNFGTTNLADPYIALYTVFELQ